MSKTNMTSATGSSQILVNRKPDWCPPGDMGPSDYKWVMAQSYASLDNDELLRAAEQHERLMLLRSKDNGESWQEDREIAHREKLGPGKIGIPSVDAFYLDPDNGLLVMFLAEVVDVDKGDSEEYIELWADAAPGMGPRTRRLFYQISRDGGRNWEPRQQIIEAGPGYDAEHWAKELWYGRSSLTIEGRLIQKQPDGTIVVPGYLWPTDEYMAEVFQEEGRPQDLCDDARYFVETLCLLGRWRSDLSGINWETGGALHLPGGYTSAGTCGSDEPTIAFLNDDRWFAVLRTSTSHVSEFRDRNIPLVRQCALSTDGGRSWKDSRSLTFEDGSPVYSPSAYSEFIRSSKNGQWYWIGNILDEPTYGNCDPRYPIQIVELDSESLSLKRDTLTVIEDKKPEDLEWIRFSNFRVYEERGSMDFLLLMTHCYCELQEGYPHLPYPSYRYRIHLPE